MTMLLITSDPVIARLRSPMSRPHMELNPEIAKLLKEPERDDQNLLSQRKEAIAVQIIFRIIFEQWRNRERVILSIYHQKCLFASA